MAHSKHMATATFGCRYLVYNVGEATLVRCSTNQRNNTVLIAWIVLCRQ